MRKFKTIKNHTITVWVVCVLLICNDFGEAKKIYSSSSRRRTPSRTTSRVTPTYSRPSSSSNSHADAAKLSYSNYNSQPNRPASAPASSVTNSKPASYGWNVPKNQGPPPAYSASNPVGGAKTNINERPPAYNPNYGSSSNVHSPISATNVRNTQSAPGSYYPQSNLPAGSTYHSPGNLPAGATYHSPGNLPAGATYHPSGSIPAGASYHPASTYQGGAGYHPPAGATYHSPGNLPAGASYYPSGNLPAGASYHPSGGYPGAPSSYGGGYHAPAAGGYPTQQLPAGATYIQPGSALPPGAVLMSAPPKSSGPGFGTGLIAGGLGGALTGALLTNAFSSHGSSSGVMPAQAAAPASSDSGGDRIIIINNGQPVNVSEAGPGTTVINTGANAAAVPAAPAADVAPAVAAPAPAVQPMDSINTPLAPLTASATNPETNPNAVPAVNPANPAAANPENPAAANPENPPAPGGIICVPVKVNETDPNDATKMIEVDKIACYPAPPPEPQAQPQAQPQPETQPVKEAATDTQAVPQQTSTTHSDSSQVPLAPFQNLPTQATLVADDSIKTRSSNAYRFADAFSVKMSIICSSLWSLLYASRIMFF